MARKKKKTVGDGLVVRGFYRVAVYDYGPNGEPNYRIASDSGICGPNQITNIGYQNIAYQIAGSNAASLASYAAVGTGTTPASNTGGLPGEIVQVSNNRGLCTLSISGSNTVQWVASWGSSSFQSSTSAVVIQNAGLYAFSQTSNQSLICGKIYATQTWASNQSCALTYQMVLSSA